MPTSFRPSTILADYAQALKEWSKTEARAYAREADEGHAPPENWRKILDTCPVPLNRWDKPDDQLPDFDEGHWVTDLVFHESITYGDIWPMMTLLPGIGHLVVKAMGTDEQIEKWYEPVIAGSYQTAFALTEPHFGSDTSQVATTATRDGDTWVLNGAKIYCTLGAIAEYVTVFATIDKTTGAAAISPFVVPKGTPGFNVVKPNEAKLGFRSSLTSALSFDDCVLPLENRLGWTSGGPSTETGRRSGQSAALTALSNNRPNISAMALGLAQASLDIATELLRERRALFATNAWVEIEVQLDRMAAALNRIRQVCFKAQYLLDEGVASRSITAMGKAYGPETCERVIRRCMQLLGPEGASHGLLLEKWYRDVKIMDIFEGSGQVQRLIVGRGLMGRLVG